jgi:DNA-binding beta-propeller fold protein YncE
LSGPYGLAVDAVNNEVWVLNNQNATITVYARTASGDTAPLRTIAGASTGLISPVYLALDLVNNEVFVSVNGAAVNVYARTANGDIAPLRTIAGAATALLGAQGIALGASAAPPPPPSLQPVPTLDSGVLAALALVLALLGFLAIRRMRA